MLRRIFGTSSTSSTTRSVAPYSASNPPTYVYKIYPSPSSNPRYAFQVPVPASHQFVLDPLDAKDGFVHLSTAPQLLPVLSRFFSTSESIVLVKIDYARLSGFKVVKWEKDGGSVDGEGGQEYPHLYRYLEGEYVDSSKEINRAEGEEGEKGGWEKALREQEELGWLEC